VLSKVTIIAAVIVLVVCSSTAFAQVKQQSFYFGAGIGNTFFSSEIDDALDEIQEIDENSTGWKIFGGFRGPKIIGIEGGYRDFGEVGANVSGETFETKTTGWDVEALGRLEISVVDVFGKAGVMFWSTDASLGSDTSDESGTDFLWGIGAGARLGPVGARLEWESVEIGGPVNLSMVTLSATLGF
jgi:hypothetical protein